MNMLKTILPLNYHEEDVMSCQYEAFWKSVDIIEGISIEVKRRLVYADFQMSLVFSLS